MGVLSPTLLALLSSLHVTLSPLSSPSLLSISSLSLSSSPSLSLHLSIYIHLSISLYTTTSGAGVPCTTFPASNVAQ